MVKRHLLAQRLCPELPVFELRRVVHVTEHRDDVDVAAAILGAMYRIELATVECGTYDERVAATLLDQEGTA